MPFRQDPGRWLRALIAPALVVLALVAAPRSDAQACGVELEFTPTENLQIVVWIEDTQGNFIDTVFITDATGRYGLGNRPGIEDFNSEFLWPYGRREGTFPIWAHRHGKEYPLLIFRNSDDGNLSHPFCQSSIERYYCQPFHSTDPNSKLQDSIDIGSCATTAYSDKGEFSPTATSLYPPRNDVTTADKGGTCPGSRDSADLPMFSQLNDLDAVSRATPQGGVAYQRRWIPRDLPDGDYVAFIEVSKEFDHNETYSAQSYPAPQLPSYGDFGRPYRGQPSTVWKVPFSLGVAAQQTFSTLEYVGYGDVDGETGTLHPPDATITTGVEGSGAGRLAQVTDPGGNYRFRLSVDPEKDLVPPGAPSEMSATEVTGQSSTIQFKAPGDDGDAGKVEAYEVRYLAGTEMTAQNFDTEGTLSNVIIAPQDPGFMQSFVLDGLTAETEYWVGVRALDDCLNSSEISIVHVVTATRMPPPVGCGCRVGGASSGPSGAALALLVGGGFLGAFGLARLARRRSVR